MMEADDHVRDRRPLRVLLTVHAPLDANAGAAGCTLRLAEGLSRRGHDVSVVGFDQLGVRTGRKPDELTFPLEASMRALRGLRSRRFDVVDASAGDLWPCPRALLARLAGIALTRSHGLEHLEARATRQASERGEVRLRRRYSLYYGGIRLRLVARSIVNADAALFLNRYERQWAIDKLRLPPDRAVLVRNGLADAFLGLPRPVIPPEGRVGIAVLGPYAWRKGSPSAAAVLSEVLQKWPNVHASWLGAPEDAVYKRMDPAVSGRVRVRAHYRLEELPSLLRGHQILLVLSRFEGLPGVVLEGMACGLAVVATDIPGTSDLISGKGAGVLVDPGDVASTVAAVEGLLGGREELESMGLRGQAEAQRHSWAEVAAETEALYRRLLERKVSVGVVGVGARGTVVDI
jgi:glycosyltransferase involved in cell wall biosynthesis